MPITPDTKNWTWVLERACPECGFDAASVDAADVAGLVRENAAAWPAVLQRPGVRERPDDATWSSLEYAAHVRDVYRICTGRLELMLEREDPLFDNWDQDATAVAERYNEQNPAEVVGGIGSAASALAELFETVDGDRWQRSGRRSDGAEFTVESFARYVIHDPVHHLWDVTKAGATR